MLENLLRGSGFQNLSIIHEQHPVRYNDKSGKINRVSVSSLKFKIMMKICEDNGDWTFKEIQEHQRNMVSFLMSGSKEESLYRLRLHDKGN